MKNVTTTLRDLKEKTNDAKINENNMKDVLSSVIECFDYINSFLNHKFDENAVDESFNSGFPTGVGSKIKLSTNSSTQIKFDREK